MATPSSSSGNEGLGKDFSEETVTSEPTSSKRRKIEALQELCQDTELDQDVNSIACRQNVDEGTPLEDDEVRWLIVGVCLHKIISPTLRKYVPQTMQRLYANLKLSDSIDTQTFAHYLRRYTPTNKELNYEAINNNSTVPKIRGRRDIQNYDYRVHDEVELSKLFLQTHMAQYTGFDDTCDSSALLGIIINVDTFPAALRSAAKAVRNDIRNEWAHCNFSQWDMNKFQTSFVLMKHMIGCLNLSAQEERDILQLTDTWENNGLDILHGAVGFSVLKELKKETKSLAEYCQSKSRTSDENFKKILQSLTNMLDELESVKTRVSALENKINGLCKHQESNKGTNYFTAPNRIEVFVGRENELKQLEENFSAADNLPCIQAISGLGGMGKTSLASEYSWKYREQYPGGVFWVSIESDNTLLDSFQQLASSVALQYKEKEKDAMREFLRWLSTRPDKWLLVADNLDSDELTETMAEFLFGFWKRDTKGHVIITTRREGKHAKETLKADFCIWLKKLTPPQSIHFLKTRTATDAVQDEEAVVALAKELDGLPLALEQAAAHIKCLQCTFQEYWAEFKTERLHLLKSLDCRSNWKMSRERLTVQTTWNMNFDCIKRQSEKEGLGTAAVTVIEIFALLPAARTNLRILRVNPYKTIIGITDWRGGEGVERIKLDLYHALKSEFKKKQILEILSRFSIVKLTKEDKVIMHPLVQETIEKEMTKSHRRLVLESFVHMHGLALTEGEMVMFR
ncbi:uncharacterized protein LOC123548028 [Mercenaria mercenaria]|uniref:uncharacterized protein LOC123548028 n=1 Tax=Mercenaria mercenaria TaxID=6596 RepID=UPI00234E6778|nr:uncharacterized protein LOC123548028 [Mercenaria mercenaria]XP_053407473.1 uncharacterized protein LOC123548028 [Mercenaria mercenaria]